MRDVRTIVCVVGALVFSASVPPRALATPIGDNGGNYTSWSNGSNQGSGLGAWNLTGSAHASFNIVSGTPDGIVWQVAQRAGDSFPSGLAIRSSSGIVSQMTMSWDFDSASLGAEMDVAANNAAQGHGSGYSSLFQIATGSNGDYMYSNESGTGDTGLTDGQWVHCTFELLDTAGDYKATISTLGGVEKDYTGSYASFFYTADTWYSSLITSGPGAMEINNLGVAPEPSSLLLLSIPFAAGLLRRRHHAITHA